MKELLLKLRSSWLLLGAGVAALLLGATLRLWQLGNLPDGLYWDEVAMYVDAQAVRETGRDMHGRPWYQVLYPSYGDYKLPVYIWLASASLWMLGPSELALRLPSVVVGILTILITGFVASALATKEKQRHPRWWGVIAMWVVAISPWSILFSRTAFEAHTGQFLVLCSVAVLVLGKGWWRWVIAAAVGGLATYAYFSVRFVWPAVLLGYWWWNLPKDMQLGTLRQWVSFIRRTVPVVILSLVVFGFALLPMVRSPLYADSNRFRLGTDSVLKMDDEVLQSNVYRELAGNQAWDRAFFHRYWLVVQELLANYADHVNLSFLFVTGDPNLRHGTGWHGLFLLPFLPIFIIGWYVGFRRNIHLALWLMVWWLGALLPASVPENTPHALRSLNALVPLSLVMTMGLYTTFQWMRTKHRTVASFVTVGWLGLLCLAILQFWTYYTTIYPTLAVDSWQGKYREVAQSVFATRTPDEPIVILPFDDKFYLWLMAYGPFGPTEWQTWQTREYQFGTVPGVTMSHQPQLVEGGTAIVAGRTEAIQNLLTTGQYVLTEQQTITATNNEAVFIVGRLSLDRKVEP